MIDAYVWTTPNGHKLLIALEELGLPYRPHWIDIGKGQQKTPEYLAINPNNKIPAIVDGATKVFESGAVLMYLAKQAGAWPSPEHVALEWMFFNAAGVGPMIGQLGYHKKYGPKRDPEQIERFTKEVDRLFGVLDRRLGESKFLAGDTYSIVDMMNFTWPNAAVTNLEFDASKHANVTRWLAEINERPAVKKALALKP